MIIVLLLPACGTESDKGREVRRNVLLITVDTLRADHLGLYEYQRPTPGIDALGEVGLTFERVLAQAPWTLPSMASVMNSLYPSEPGAWTTAVKRSCKVAGNWFAAWMSRSSSSSTSRRTRAKPGTPAFEARRSSRADGARRVHGTSSGDRCGQHAIHRLRYAPDRMVWCEAPSASEVG